MIELFAQLPDVIDAQTFEEFVLAIARWMALIAFPLAVIFIIYSGFLFVTAGGSEDKVKRAKTTLLWTLLGLAIVIGAYALATAFVEFAKGL